MSFKHSHKVKTHKWNRGVLETTEFLFFSIEEAFKFIKDHGHRNVKIYDNEDRLIHSVNNGSIETYA